jgi:hypothetical protein
MLPEIKHFSVNWIDGMKINKNHFIQLENAISDQLRDAIGFNLTNYNYGLLPPAPGMNNSLDLHLDFDQARMIRLKLLECRAITHGGARIEIVNSQQHKLTMPLDQLSVELNSNELTENEYDIIVTVNPFNHIPTGSPNPEENPPRHPYTIPEYRIQIIPQGQLNDANQWAYHLIVGKMRVVGGEVKLYEDYIPPCSTIGSHSPLLDIYYNLGNILSAIGSNTTKILQKIKSKGQQDSLAQNVLYLSEKIVFFLANEMTPFRLLNPDRPPVFMIIPFIQLAHLTKTALYCMPINEKEELANYFSDWTERSPGAFENIMEDLIAVEYNHMNISAAVKQVKKFADVISTLCEKLSELDYIGKTKPKTKPARGILVNEESEDKKRKGWSF